MPPRDRSILPLVTMVLGLVSLSLPGVAMGQDPPSPPLSPGDVEAVGSTFSAQSDSMLLGVTASESLRVAIHMAGTQALISVGRVGENTTVNLAISGYPPNTTLFMAIDSLLDVHPVQTDENGTYAFTLDVENARLLLFQRWKNTLQLTPTGWSDPTAGTWDPITRTGTLTRDIYDQIVIAGSNLTLEGAGHSCVYTGSGAAVSVSGQSPVTIRNLNVLSRYDALTVTNSPSTTVRQCYLRTETASSALYAWATMVVGRCDNLLVTRSTLRSPLGYGIVLRCSWYGWFRNPVVRENDITATTPLATGSYQVDYGQCLNNNIVSLLGVPPTITLWNPTWSLAPPVGGNYWNVWTTPDADADGFVDVPFVFRNGRDDWPYARPQAWGATGYTIVASAGPGGTISPPGSVSVAVGASQTFTVIPDAGYGIADVVVDGSSIGPASSYTFPEVIADHAISATFISLNRPPVLSSIADQTVAEGLPFSLTVTASDPDLPPQPLTFSLLEAPTGMTLDPTSGSLTWTPPEEAGPGDYVVTVAVSDGQLPPMADSASFTIHVSEVNHPPVLEPLADQALDELTWLTVPLKASDPDVPGNGLAVSLVDAPNGMTITMGSIIWQPTEAQGPGDYAVTVRVADDGVPPLSAQQVVHIRVNEVNLPPVLAEMKPWVRIPEGEEFTFFPSATDPDLPAQVLTFTLEGAPDGATIDPVHGDFAWTPTEAQGPGDYTFTVRVTDNGTPPLSDEQAIGFHVNEVNLPPVITPLARQYIPECAAFSLPIAVTDPDLPANNLTYTLLSGPEGATLDPASGRLDWTPTEAQGPGVYSAIVKVTDDGVPPLEDTETFAIEVTEVNLPPVLTLPGPFTLDEGGTLTFTATATDPDLPANTLTFSLLPTSPPGASIDPVTGAASWPAVDDGSYSIGVRVDDGNLGFTTGEVPVTVVNVSPTATINGPSSGDVYAVGDLVTFSGSFTDPGAADTHGASWALDGIVIPGTVDQVAHTVSATYAFTAPGVYKVTLSVTDDDGGIGSSNLVQGVEALIVVYDPAAGFVTGHGTFVSPPGAYRADPALSGRAVAAFVSRYQRGARVPTGETEFRFMVARFSFHSTVYEWMVLGGTRAQYKGRGEVNGAGDFGFLITAVDGDLAASPGPDLLRVKIWDRASGATVYDNMLGAPDDGTPTTVLEGGCIVIQTGVTYQPNFDPLAMYGSGPATETPIAFALRPPAPNPFRGTVTLAFDLPVESRVHATVHDVGGRAVADVLDATLGAGAQQRAWDGRDRAGRALEPGVYFLRFEARALAGGDGLSAVRRIVLVR